MKKLRKKRNQFYRYPDQVSILFLTCTTLTFHTLGTQFSFVSKRLILADIDKIDVANKLNCSWTRRSQGLLFSAESLACNVSEQLNPRKLRAQRLERVQRGSTLLQKLWYAHARSRHRIFLRFSDHLDNSTVVLRFYSVIIYASAISIIRPITYPSLFTTQQRQRWGDWS